MTTLTGPELDLLRKVRTAKCDTGCPCKDWARALADQLRRELPDVDDIALARVALMASQHGHRWAHHHADGFQVAVVLCAAASDLAALHLG